MMDWNADPLVIVPVAALAWLFASGLGRLAHSSRSARQLTGRAAAFTAGWLAIFLALVSPLDAMGGVLFSAHMLQHVLLMLAAAPLLIASRPLGPMLMAFPSTPRRALVRTARHLRIHALTRLLERPVVAWSIHAVSLWLWHVPVLFEASLRSDAAHAAQHVSFFGSALLFWSSVLPMRVSPANTGVAMLSIFTTMLHSSVLGALLTFAPAAWYSAYHVTTRAWGLTPLEDQQLGGLLMWIPAGVVYVAAALMLVGRMLRRPAASIPEAL